MNHLTDDPRIADLLSGVRVGTARRHGGLAVRPLLGPTGYPTEGYPTMGVGKIFLLQVGNLAAGGMLIRNLEHNEFARLRPIGWVASNLLT
jgi:hypothetical protein